MHLKILSGKWRPFCPGGDESIVINHFLNHIKYGYLELYLWNCPQENATWPTSWLVNIGFRKWLGVIRQQTVTLQWRHNGQNSISNHQPHDCLRIRLFRPRSKKTSKLRVTGLCARNSPVTGEFPTQMASYAENVSIWWCHHDLSQSWPSSMKSYKFTHCGLVTPFGTTEFSHRLFS